MSVLRRPLGVTLVELIVVMAITGIIAAVVATFIRRPVEGYADAARRASLTDEADTALRRMSRDLRRALPNSVRVDGTGKFVEFIEVTGGGRYRAEKGSNPADDPLDFSVADDSFDVLGPLPTVVAGNEIVVYNLYSTGPVSNAYAGDNRAAFVSTGVPSKINIASTLFPEPSPGKRFHVVTGPVTYGCIGGQLLRYWGYVYNAAQVVPPVGGSSAILAGNVDVGECQFVYTAGALTERIATVSIILQINSTAASGAVERVRMFQQAQVSNVP